MTETSYWKRRQTRRGVLTKGAATGVGAVSLAIVGCGGSGDDDDDTESIIDAPTASATKQAEVQSFLYQREDTSSKAAKGGIYTTYYTGDVTLDPLSATSYSSAYQTAYIIRRCSASRTVSKRPRRVASRPTSQRAGSSRTTRQSPSSFNRRQPGMPISTAERSTPKTSSRRGPSSLPRARPASTSQTPHRQPRRSPRSQR